MHWDLCLPLLIMWVTLIVMASLAYIAKKLFSIHSTEKGGTKPRPFDFMRSI